MTTDIPRSRTSLEKEARDYSAINIDLSHTSITNLTLSLIGANLNKLQDGITNRLVTLEEDLLDVELELAEAEWKFVALVA